MTPRTDIIALPIDATTEQILDLVTQSGRSRYPVYSETIDDIVGIVLAKQMLVALRQNGELRLANLMREPMFVPRTREVEDVLADMKRIKLHMAIVLGEYGGTEGIVTMEDLLEEIVGEIYDEYDEDDADDDLPETGEDGITVQGDAEIADLNRQFQFDIGDEYYQTIGGMVFGQIGRLPVVGDRIVVGGITMEVLGMDGRRIDKLKIFPVQSSDAGVPSPS